MAISTASRVFHGPLLQKISCDPSETEVLPDPVDGVPPPPEVTAAPPTVAHSEVVLDSPFESAPRLMGVSIPVPGEQMGERVSVNSHLAQYSSVFRRIF